MKEENSEENIEITNYDLSEINKDNDIQFYSLNIEDPKESSKEPSTTKKEKMKLNYSLLIKNIISDINDNRKERYYEGEYKINLIYFLYYQRNGDWRLGIGDWGLGIGDWAPIPNPQSPISSY